ncbi:three-Cys-motif partner protein TcmP [Nocardia sp. NPDC057668]|uniref:three-Cys-motif partner protein TcmP n=1 Tax=Nocardia sp. NPDC057668 TaxID=3346202 RepID=UPI00366EADC6
MAREWSYWTSNKLQILGDYIPAFNTASKRSEERLYLDLMAGRPENVQRLTGEVIDGSPRRVLSAAPGFTRHYFFELPSNAGELDAVLRKDFPLKNFRVVSGDCNRTIDGVLAELRDFRWAPTFVFIDQQAAEVEWETLVKLARFKGEGAKTKPELWLLVSPAFVARGVGGRKSHAFREKVTRFYGTCNWLNIQEAREAREISGEEYRDEMVNLIRHQLAERLGYKFTQRIPMRMTNKSTIYDMVFAGDHDVGDKIMQHLYNKAAEREPEMMAEACRLKALQQEEQSGKFALFDLPPVTPQVKVDKLWRPTSYWQPGTRKWWTERDRGLGARP